MGAAGVLPPLPSGYMIVHNNINNIIVSGEIILNAKNSEQRTQLSLTNRATRSEVRQGHHAWYRSIC